MAANAEKDTIKVMPAQIKTALAESYERYKASKEESKDGQDKSAESRDSQSLEERASAAREGSSAMADHDIPFDEKTR